MSGMDGEDEPEDDAEALPEGRELRLQGDLGSWGNSWGRLQGEVRLRRLSTRPG